VFLYVSMPELPEVETVVRQLNSAIANLKINDVQVYFGIRNQPEQKSFISTLVGKTILKVERRAKVIIFRLSDDMTMVAHLKMSGKFFIHLAEVKPDKHTHVVLRLDNDKQLFWHDVRKFGYLKIMTNLEVDDWFLNKNFGPEPLLDTFTPAVFKRQLLTRKNAKIKNTLLDQSVVAGVGNIYDIEALWLAKIHPLRVINTLTDSEIELLHQHIVAILHKSVAANGTSSDDFLDTSKKRGTFQDELKVYGKENTPCPRCATIFTKIKLNGRGTVFCPSCQI